MGVLKVYDSNMETIYIAMSGAGTKDSPASISTAGGGEVVFPVSMVTNIDGVVPVAGRLPVTLEAAVVAAVRNETVLASGTNARTSAAFTSEFTGGHFIVDVTAWTANTVVTIEAFDATSGKYYPILIGAAITAIGTYVLKVLPSGTPVSNAVTNDSLPETWRVVVTGTATYSVGVNYV